MTVASRLFDLAASIRQAIVDYYDIEADAPSLPAERLIVNCAFAQHALDCEQLVVAVDDLAPDIGGEPTGRSFGGYAATITVGVVRCVPVLSDSGDPPSAAEIEASAAVVLADLSLVGGALAVWAAATQTCRYVTLGRGAPIGPEGGVGGVTFPLVVTL